MGKPAGPVSYSRNILAITIPSAGYLAVTGAVNLILSKTLGFACELERIEAVTTVVATGGAGSRVLNVRRGDASGTVVGTITLAIATQATLGVVNAGTLTAGPPGTTRFNDTDTITVQFAGSGTAFTAGGVDLVLTLRDKEQLAV